MYILGINSAYHESSACLLKDGEIVAAAEEERFNRVKHAKAAQIDNPHVLPEHAIRYCIETAGIAPRDVSFVGYSLNPEKRLRNIDFEDAVTESGWGSRRGEETFYSLVRTVPDRVAALGLGGEFKWIDHQLCHAASAYYPSPFPEAAILTVDGIGETSSAAFAVGNGAGIRIVQECTYPASIGFLWEKFSKFLGFTAYDAYKVMGLAAYGDPDAYGAAFKRLVRLLPRGMFSIDNDTLRFRLEYYGGLEALFGVERRRTGGPLLDAHRNIAAALQNCTNTLILHMVEWLHEISGSKNLCMAGGVALNCISNRFAFEEGPFERLFVQPCAHDAGTALGAAMVIWNMTLKRNERAVMKHIYYGPRYSEAEIVAALEARGVSYRKIERIERTVARLIRDGKIVGWFQGCMEFGPRALGNRSLLADPRDPDSLERLNRTVKHRERFRPLAPSVLAEYAREWFSIGKPSPGTEYMLLAYNVKERYRAMIPAAIHVDGSSRIHVVQRGINPKYHSLIEEFHRLTNVPCVINTSFNDREPIVCTPGDAIATFLKAGIDCLAIEDFLIGADPRG